VGTELGCLKRVLLYDLADLAWLTCVRSHRRRPGCHDDPSVLCPNRLDRRTEPIVVFFFSFAHSVSANLPNPHKEAA
jgi:hypothetical protein